MVIVFAVGAFALAYGVLAVDAGLSPIVAVLSSMIIVSGAAQFSMVGLLAGGPIPVLVAATGLGLRHIPMSARLAEMIGPQPLRTRMRLAFILVDETFGLTVRAAESGVEDLVAYKGAADLLLFASWVAGTAIGAWFGTIVDPGLLGVGVMFGLLFLGLAAPMLKNRRDWLVAGASVLATLIAMRLLPTAWQVSVAATVAGLVGLVGDE